MRRSIGHCRCISIHGINATEENGQNDNLCKGLFSYQVKILGELNPEMAKSASSIARSSALCFLNCLVILFFLLVAPSCSATGAKTAASDQGNEGWHELKIGHGGLERWFRVYRPEGLPRNAAAVGTGHPCPVSSPFRISGDLAHSGCSLAIT